MSLQVSVAIDIDTTGLRSPPKSSAKSLAVKERLAHWSPAPSKAVDLDGKMERAAKRRHSIFAKRAGKLSARNVGVAAVAEAQLAQTKAKTAEAESALQASLLSAEEKRKAAVATRVEHAKGHLEHARQIAGSQRAIKELLLHERHQSIKRRLAQAEAKQLAKLQAKQAKLQATAAKTAAIACERAAQLQMLQQSSETKLVAAEIRRADLTEERLSKLGRERSRAKQVRRNKGSTASHSTAIAEKVTAATNKPMVFEVDIKAPLSPMKSPVQIRLEQRAAAAMETAEAMADANVDAEAGVRRRLNLISEKTKALSAKNQRTSNVVKRKLSDQATETQALQAKLSARQSAADGRRGARLTAIVKKASSQFQQARTIAQDKRKTVQAQTTEAKEAAEMSSEAASHRKLIIDMERAAKGTAFATPWSTQRIHSATVASVVAC